MALALQDLNSYTNQWIVPKMTDVYFKNDPWLARLQSRNKVSFPGGTQIVRPLAFAKLNGDFFDRTDSFNTSYVVTDTALQVAMKYAYVNISLYGTDDVLNMGPEAVFSMVTTKMKSAGGTMSERLSQALYKDGQSSALDVAASGAPPVLSTQTSFTGALSWIDDGNTGSGYPVATGLTKSFASVGQIARADLQTVQSTGSSTSTANLGGLNAYTNRAFSSFTLSEIQNACGKAWYGNDFVDLILTNQPGYDKFWQATQPLQRYTDSNTDLAKIGFNSFRFNQADVVVSKYMPEGLMLGINSKYVEFYITNNRKFQLGFTGFKEAQNTVNLSGQYLFAGNLLISNPRTCFKLVGSALQ